MVVAEKKSGYEFAGFLCHDNFGIKVFAEPIKQPDETVVQQLPGERGAGAQEAAEAPGVELQIANEV